MTPIAFAMILAGAGVLLFGIAAVVNSVTSYRESQEYLKKEAAKSE